MTIPLVDLAAQYQPLKEDILRRIGGILDGMHLFLGPNVQAFEQEFAAYQEVEHGIGVSDGTCALQLALMASEQVAGEVLSLPMYPELTAEQRTVVVDAILEFYGRGG